MFLVTVVYVNAALLVRVSGVADEAVIGLDYTLGGPLGGTLGGFRRADCCLC